MDNHEAQHQGDGMKTEREILEDLQRTMKELNVTLEVARAVNAIKLVQGQHDEQKREFSELRTDVLKVVALVRDVFVAEYDGQAHGVEQKKNVLRKHGLLKDQSRR